MPNTSKPTSPDDQLFATFTDGSVVQLISNRGDAGLDVVHLQDATVQVTRDGIVAVTESDEWTWWFRDLEAVLHSHDSSWTILSVPGVTDFGVSVSPDDVSGFRRALDPGRNPETLADVPVSDWPAPVVPTPTLEERPVDRLDALMELGGPTDRDADVASPEVVDDPALADPPAAAEAPPSGGEQGEQVWSAAEPEAWAAIFGPMAETESAVDDPEIPDRADPIALDDVVSGAVAPSAEARTEIEIDPEPETDRGAALEPIRIDFDGWPGVAGPGASNEVHPPPPLAADAPTVPVAVATATAIAERSGQGELTGIAARSISAWFGTHHVLDRVSLEMPGGEVTALIGPSGCGKSTFLRILNRMHEMIPGASLAGEVLLDGADVYDASRKLTDARRQIGMVFQKPNPFPAMSIYDNVIASFRLTGTKATQGVKDETVEACLSKAGLWNEVRDRLRQPGGSLSGGQQQRLCIARALAIRPRVLLMDEPCSALDPTSTRRIEQTIVELRTEVTIVIVTHNMQQAVRVSNRCAFFLAEQGRPGVIVEHGETEAMFHSPQDQRTFAYVNGQFG